MSRSPPGKILNERSRRVYSLEIEGERIPEASSPERIIIDKPGSFVTLVSVNMPLVRAEMDLQYVKKTVTLPKWLNDLAEEAGVNFSKTLQAAIKLKLDSPDQPICVNEGNKNYSGKSKRKNKSN